MVSTERVREFVPPGQSYFLFGPRGVGKSSLIRDAERSDVRFDFLDPAVYREFSAFPERLRNFALPGKTVILDEIQRVPELLDVVHSLLESGADYRFVMTGSSSRKLRREGTNLLAGRALRCELHPFIAAELGGDFNLAKALLTGMVPLVVSSRNPPQVLRTYVALYIQEEVKTEGYVRSISDFNRFLEVASFSHGSQINYSNVAQEAQIGRKAVESYFQILIDLLLAVQIPVFAKRARRDLVRHEKFYFFDAGVYRSLRRAGPLDPVTEIEGAALEGLVMQHLRAWIAYRGGQETLSFWRTHSGLEVDFVVYGGESFTAIEVKNNPQVRTGDLKGMRAFKEQFPEAHCVLLYRGSQVQQIEGILCLPVERFLNQVTSKTDLVDIS